MKENRKRLNKYVKVQEDGDRLFLYNMLSGKLYVANGEKKEQISMFIEGENFLDQEFYNTLEKAGVFVNNDFDEIGLCELQYNQMVYSKEALDITIIPTNDCNFKCVYCYENHRKEFMSEDTADSIIKFYRKNARFYKYLIVSWFGGEPLLRLDIIEYIMKQLMDISHKNGVVVRSMITTNGYLLTENAFCRLMKVGVRNYQITVDGLENTHNLQRPHKVKSNSFEVIISNLKEIMENHETGRYEIGIRFNISQEMNESREKILSFYHKNFGGWKQLSFIFEWIRDWGGEIDQNIVTKPEICIEWFISAKERGLRCFELFQNACGMYFCEACKLNGFVIDFDGSIHKCTLAMEDKEYKAINQIGHFDKNGNLNFNENLVKWFKRNQRESCKECVYYPICMGINCPLDTIIKNNFHCIPHKVLLDKYIDTLFMTGKYIDL